MGKTVGAAEPSDVADEIVEAPAEQGGDEGVGETDTPETDAVTEPRDGSLDEVGTPKRKLGRKGVIALVLAGVVVLAGGGVGGYFAWQHFDRVAAEEAAAQAEADAAAAAAAAEQAIIDGLAVAISDGEAVLEPYAAIGDDVDSAEAAAAIAASAQGAYTDGLVALLDVLNAGLAGEGVTELRALLEQLTEQVEAAGDIDAEADLEGTAVATSDIERTVEAVKRLERQIGRAFLTAAEADVETYALASGEAKDAVATSAGVLSEAIIDGAFDPQALLGVQDALGKLWAEHNAAAAAAGQAPVTPPSSGGSPGTGGGNPGSGTPGGGSAPPPVTTPPPPPPPPAPNSSYATKTGVMVIGAAGCLEFYGSGGTVWASYSSNIVVPSDSLNHSASDRGGGAWQVSFECAW